MSKTVRILSLDGGGTRGYMSALFMERFCQAANIDPSKIHDYFDVICGTSIGGIQALGYAYGLSAQDMQGFFTTKGQSIFPYTSGLIGDTGPANIYELGGVLAQLAGFGDVVYQQEPLSQALREALGEPAQGDLTKKMSSLPGKVFVTAWDYLTSQKKLFSNIGGLEPFLTGSDEYAVNAGLATSAAPLYFPRAVFGNAEYTDGGVIQNNPSLLGYAVGKRLFPSSTRIAVLSVGTGSTLGTAPTPVPPEAMTLEESVKSDIKAEILKVKHALLQKYPQASAHLEHLESVGNLFPIGLENITYLMNIAGKALIDGSQNLVHDTLQFMSESLFENLFYYRFQITLSENDPKELDDARAETYAAWKAKVDELYGTPENPTTEYLKMKNFIDHAFVSDTCE